VVGQEGTVLFADRAGEFGFYVSGVEPTKGAYSGAGNGIPGALDPTVDLMRARTDTYSVTGYLKRFVQCNDKRGCR
jgi:hypothetical protein